MNIFFLQKFAHESILRRSRCSFLPVIAGWRVSDEFAGAVGRGVLLGVGPWFSLTLGLG